MEKLTMPGHQEKRRKANPAKLPNKRETPATADAEEVRRIPLSQLATRAPYLDAFYDPEITPDRNRLRAIIDESRPNTDKLVSAGTMYRGQIRTFSGGLAHENGRFISRKARRLLHWEGIAQRALLIRTESDYRYISLDSECMRIVTSDGFERYEHTLDVVLERPDGSELAIEVKRTERDLECPKIRAKYAATAEVLRRCGIGFEIVFADEIFVSRHHRKNAELFASRAFVCVGKHHIDRLESLAVRRGTASTYGELSEVLDPGSPLTGKAVLQALTVQRRVEIDITRPLTSDTPLTLH
jgi:hypothetical protein